MSELTGDIKLYTHTWLCGACGRLLAFSMNVQEEFLVCEFCYYKISREQDEQ